MYTNHSYSTEYPFHGFFYNVFVDDNKPLEEQTAEEVVVFETDCDMSEGTSLSTDTFTIFFPFNSETQEIVIKEGDLFRGQIFGVNQKGRVIGIYPSQLGGCTVLLTRI